MSYIKRDSIDNYTKDDAIFLFVSASNINRSGVLKTHRAKKIESFDVFQYVFRVTYTDTQGKRYSRFFSKKTLILTANDFRKYNGKVLVSNGKVFRVGAFEFNVAGSLDQEYYVEVKEVTHPITKKRHTVGYCNCHDDVKLKMYNVRLSCKHIHAVKEYMELSKKGILSA